MLCTDRFESLTSSAEKAYHAGALAIGTAAALVGYFAHPDVEAIFVLYAVFGLFTLVGALVLPAGEINDALARNQASRAPGDTSDAGDGARRALLNTQSDAMAMRATLLRTNYGALALPAGEIDASEGDDLALSLAGASNEHLAHVRVRASANQSTLGAAGDRPRKGVEGDAPRAAASPTCRSVASDRNIVLTGADRNIVLFMVLVFCSGFGDDASVNLLGQIIAEDVRTESHAVVPA